MSEVTSLRVSLLYITEVSGHHSATLAIEQALRRLSPHAALTNINAFNYTNPISEKVVNRLYMSVIKKAPRLWEYLYDNQAIVKRIERAKQAIHRFNSPKFKELFASHAPDAVVCTQAFPCGMVADYKHTYDQRLPLIAVLTDYVPHSYWIYENVDYYVVPSQEVGARLARKGVPVSKIKPLGIPCDPRFGEQLDRIALMQRMGLDPSCHTVLVMGGGQGLGPLHTIVKALDASAVPMQMIVVTGTNKKLHALLLGKAAAWKKSVTLLGYATNVNELMGVADLVITKPGGITTAEALARTLPMVVVHPIPGQEANNTMYLTSHGAAVKVEDPLRAAEAVEAVLSSPGKLAGMREACRTIAKPRAAHDIARLVCDAAETYRISNTRARG